MRNDNDTIIKMYNEGKSYTEIAKALDRSYESVRGFIRRYRKKGVLSQAPPKMDKVQSYTITNDKRTIEGMIKITDNKPITPEIAMKMHGLNPNEWTVISFTSNVWEMGDDTKAQYKVVVKQKNSDELSIEDIDNYFKNKDFSLREHSKKIIPTKTNYTLEIDYADAHWGLLSWEKESGKNYDLQIAQERFLYIIDDIVERSKDKNFDSIVFALLGDILHIDNTNNTTTKGTPQTVDGRVPKILDIAVDMMITTIDKLLELKLPIKVISTYGNHSRSLEYALFKGLELAYKNNPNIEFDISPNPQKIVRIGCNLVGLCHGDMSRKNIGIWLPRDFKQEYGQSKFAEVHCGHLHEEAVKSYGGILVKTLPAICESSNWEHEEGYSSNKGIMCFVWDKEKGLRETWYNYL